MSILETFITIFKSDTASLVKGTKKAEKTTDDLNKKLKKTEDYSEKVGKGFLSLAKQAAGFLGITFSAVSIFGAIKSSAEYALQLDKLSESLEINVSELDAWSKSVEIAGGTSESFGTSIVRLNKDLIQFATTGHSAVSPYFKSLGIAMVGAKGKARKVTDVLLDLAGSLSKVSKVEAFAIGERLGLDENLIDLLVKGKVAVGDLIKKQKEMGVQTKEGVKNIKKLTDSFVILKHNLKSVFSFDGEGKIVKFLDIFLGKLHETFSFLRKNESFVKGIFIGMGLVIAKYLLPYLYRAAAAMIVLNAIPIAIGVGIAILVGIFALLYDDIVTFINGGDSLIGRAVKKWPVLIDVFKAIGKAVKWLLDSFTFSMGRMSESWNAWVKLISLGGGAIVNGIKKVRDALKKEKGIGISVDETVRVNQIASAANAQLNAAASSPFNSPVSTSSIYGASNINRNTTTNISKIEINTQATDAEGISNQIGIGLREELARTTAIFDDGVKA